MTIGRVRGAAAALAVIFVGFAAGGAQAAPSANRAWVSGHGVDQAGCGSPTNPCRTFQYAHDNVVAAGGEIDALDPAGYGAITITKAISIVNDGVGTAGVQQGTSGASAITIQASSSDEVLLRGLEIEGLGTGKNGVELDSAFRLTIVNCAIRRFTQSGVLLMPSSASGGVIVSISNTLLSSNGYGVYAYPQGSATVQGTISNVEATGNFEGVGIDGSASSAAGSYLVANEVNASKNWYDGFYAYGSVTLALTRSLAIGKGYHGVFLGNNAVVGSYGDNRVWRNGESDVYGGSLTPFNGN